jgi:hypothetical protein
MPNSCWNGFALLSGSRKNWAVATVLPAIAILQPMVVDIIILAANREFILLVSIVCCPGADGPSAKQP